MLVPLVSLAACAGQERQRRSGGGCASGCTRAASEEALLGTSRVGVPERAPDRWLGARPSERVFASGAVGGSRSGPWGSPRRPGAEWLARDLRAGCVAREPKRLGDACLASGRPPKRLTAGRQRPKPEPGFARPFGSTSERGRHPEVEARVREGRSEGCLPAGPQPRLGHERKTRSRTTDDTFPGVRSLSAKAARAVVACRFASPTPSVLRVSHPLDGLIPPGPCGFVSPHIRP